MYLARPFAVAGTLALAAASAWMPTGASAQQIYKIVGPNGRVTFSDRPSDDPAAKASAAAAVTVSANGGPNLAGLPFELRQAAARFPVTLYTSPGCGTCAQGRAMLQSRGIPFAEKTVATKEDADALMRMTGAGSVPVLTIGAQQLKGFSDNEWSQFLSAAGYPTTSQLPPTYTPAPATPLVALDQLRPADARPSQAATPAQQQPQRRSPDDQPPANPANIQF